MMRSLSGVGWTVFCLLVWKRTTAQSVGLHCSVGGQAEARHPVQGLLERFEAGPGCAARERGNKETHVVAVGRATSSTENKVTVLLKPLSLTPSPLRALHLLLSSKLPITWSLEAERLPPNLPVLVQVSSNSSVQSSTLHLHVQIVHSLPFRPRALHRWALKHQGNLTSLTHTPHGNRVYVKLGEDPTLPPVCQLQSMFLSHNYMTSDLQRQDVQGCSDTPISPEVHVIKLHSAGSGLCGSLQVEVVVSLVPPVVNSKTQRVVLILSSSVPVNWAIVSHGVQGHVSVHSSNSISPPYPPDPDLIVSSSLNSDLSSIPDLLLWANENGYTKVTSYTEADLANRFVIQLARGGTDEVAGVSPLVVKPLWAEERRLRQWLNGGDGARGGRESFTVQCEDGRLDVTVDQQTLQSLFPVAAVTLRDSTCQAQSNGSHFLLAFPVISCGTEGLIMGQPRGVQYKNMVLLWREKPQTVLTLNETEKRTNSPLGIHFSCLAAVPVPLPGPAESNEDDVNTPQVELVPWPPKGPGPDLGPSHLPLSRYRSGPVLALSLFVSEGYEQGRVGPCVIPADHRVYVEISAKGSFIDAVEVKSCVVSPLSDPKKSRFWSVIRDGCSSDPSLTLTAKTRDEEEEEEESEGEEELEKDETEPLGKSSMSHRDRAVSLKNEIERSFRKAKGRMEKRSMRKKVEEETRPLRFSFNMRPVFNDSVQFLHCSLRLCLSDSLRGEPMEESGERDCQSGLHIPPLRSRSPGSQSQCETRNLSRPMVVTQPISSLAPKLLRPPAGQRTKRLSVSPLTLPNLEKNSPVILIGPLIGIVFIAFVMGVILMGGLWCIYIKTGGRPASLGGDGHFTDQTHENQNIWSPPSLSDQSSSSV